MTARRSPRGAALPASLAVLTMLAGCGGPTAAAPEQRASGGGLMPSDTGAGRPAPDLDLGTVRTGRSAVATLSGTASVGFDAPELVGLVAALDCSACTGPAELTSPDHGTPWGTAQAASTGQFLVDLTGAMVPDRVEVAAEGDWTLTLSSPEDLPAATGPQSGSGPVVLRVADEGAQVRVAVTPDGAQDALSARLLSTAGDEPVSMVVGADGPVDQAYPVPMPGLVALDTDGEWTVTVTP